MSEPMRCERCQFEDKPSPEHSHIIRWHEAECTAITNRTPERQP